MPHPLLIPHKSRVSLIPPAPLPKRLISLPLLLRRGRHPRRQPRRHSSASPIPAAHRRSPTLMLRKDAKFQSANGTADKYCSRRHGLGVVVAVTALVVVYCRIGEEFIGMMDRHHFPLPPSATSLSRCNKHLYSRVLVDSFFGPGPSSASPSTYLHIYRFRVLLH